MVTVAVVAVDAVAEVDAAAAEMATVTASLAKGIGP